MRRSWLGVVLVLGLMSLTPAVGASPPEYEVVDLGSIGSGPYYMSVATGINAAGQIVGQSAENIAATVHLILWEKDARMVDLGVAPDGGYINTAAINNRGQLVGTIVEGCEQPGSIPGFGCPSVGFVWDGEWTLILGEGSLASETVDINARGQVLGREYHPEHGLRAFVWRDGEFVYLEDALDRPAAINDRGQVVGQRTDEAGRSVPVIWTNGVVVEVDTPGESAYVSDVNNRGQVVGSYMTGVRSHAFRWQDGLTTDLLAPSGAVWSAAAYAINDQGQAVGSTWRLVGSASEPTSLVGNAVIWATDGGVTELASTGGRNCAAFDVNARSQVVGSCWLEHGPRAFLWKK